MSIYTYFYLSVESTSLNPSIQKFKSLDLFFDIHTSLHLYLFLHLYLNINTYLLPLSYTVDVLVLVLCPLHLFVVAGALLRIGEKLWGLCGCGTCEGSEVLCVYYWFAPFVQCDVEHVDLYMCIYMYVYTCIYMREYPYRWGMHVYMPLWWFRRQRSGSTLFDPTPGNKLQHTAIHSKPVQHTQICSTFYPRPHTDCLSHTQAWLMKHSHTDTYDTDRQTDRNTSHQLIKIISTQTQRSKRLQCAGPVKHAPAVCMCQEYETTLYRHTISIYTNT